MWRNKYQPWKGQWSQGGADHRQRSRSPRRRAYAVCGCGKWRWCDKLAEGELCQCGAAFADTVAGTSPAPQFRDDASIGRMQQLMAKQLELLRSVLPEAYQADLDKHFPKIEPVKQPEPAKVAYKEYTASVQEYKRLSEKSLKQHKRAQELADELAKLREDVATTDKELEEAEKLQSVKQKSYSEAVKDSSKPPAKQQQAAEAPAAAAAGGSMEVDSEAEKKRDEDEKKAEEESRKSFDDLTGDLDEEKKRQLHEHIEKMADSKRRKKDASLPDFKEVLEATKAMGECMQQLHSQQAATQRG